MNYAITPQLLQWELFSRYGCWQVLTILLAKSDAYGCIGTNMEFIESKTGMSHTTVRGIIETFKEHHLIGENELGRWSLGAGIPEGVMSGELQPAAECDGFSANATDSNKATKQQSNTTSKKQKTMSYGVQRFKKPTIEEVAAWIREKGYHFDAEYFWNTFETRGWVVGRARTPMKNWRAACVTFEKNELKYQQEKQQSNAKPNSYQQQRDEARALLAQAEASSHVNAEADRGFSLGLLD